MVAITSKLAGDTVSPAVTEREPHGSSSGDDLVTLSEFQPLSEEAVRKKAVASRAAQTLYVSLSEYINIHMDKLMR